MPETPVMLSGWKPEIDGEEWLVTEVEDSFGEHGYGTRIRCEKRGTT
ncbi:hypothetical protein [Larsenimonas rhizosphaerae]|nr:hypothetical protein [Larsenimonas rhizosphaerae]MCM2132197.1 hypothetical protein [Larsenimonas rhizosphaerae]